jgi:hypothetical protein
MALIKIFLLVYLFTFFPQKKEEKSKNRGKKMAVNNQLCLERQKEAIDIIE